MAGGSDVNYGYVYTVESGLTNDEGRVHCNLCLERHGDC